MKKIAVFTEGQGELIFIRHLLIQLIGYECLSFECFELNSDRLLTVPYKHCPPAALIHYQLINVGTDERVLSAIIERYDKFVDTGFQVIGVRDMYSAEYKKRADHIDETVNGLLINAVEKALRELDNNDKIHFFFAIMELEAWLLGMDRNFERIHNSITHEAIRGYLGFDLQTIDPETSFFQPAIQLKRILGLANIYYDKHRSDMESLVSRITLDDFESLATSGRCNSFALFYSEIKREFSDLQNA